MASKEQQRRDALVFPLVILAAAASLALGWIIWAADTFVFLPWARERFGEGFGPYQYQMLLFATWLAFTVGEVLAIIGWHAFTEE